jgi:hypothetical protein
VARPNDAIKPYLPGVEDSPSGGRCELVYAQDGKVGDILCFSLQDGGGDRGHCCLKADSQKRHMTVRVPSRDVESIEG